MRCGKELSLFSGTLTRLRLPSSTAFWTAVTTCANHQCLTWRLICILRSIAVPLHMQYGFSTSQQKQASVR